MKTVFSSSRVRAGQAGIGLVEILVAMTLGLILTIGMVEVFLSSKQAYRGQEALSRVQENGRYLMEVLSRDIRMAGYQGCPSLDIVTPNIIANPPPTAGFSSSQAILGYELKTNGSWSPAFAGAPSGVIKGTDAITVSRADNCGAYLTGNMTADNANIQLNPDNTCNFNAGDYVLISDCLSTDIFRATTVSLGASKITIAHANNMNTSNRLSKPYGTDAQIFKFVQTDYYIKTNNFGETALYSRTNGVESELIDGVEDLQFLFGEDTTADKNVDVYRQASAVNDWAAVGSVRFNVGLRSVLDNVVLEDNSYQLDGVAVTNKRMRQQLDNTVALRNRLQ